VSAYSATSRNMGDGLPMMNDTLMKVIEDKDGRSTKR
jgi:hypothetical protein